MRKNVSSLGQYQPEDTETLLTDMFPRLVRQAYEKGDISETVRNHYLTRELKNLDDLSECYNGMLEAINQKKYYLLLARIEKAEMVIDQEEDMHKRQFYIKKMRELAEELERLRPA